MLTPTPSITRVDTRVWVKVHDRMTMQATATRRVKVTSNALVSQLRSLARCRLFGGDFSRGVGRTLGAPASVLSLS